MCIPDYIYGCDGIVSVLGNKYGQPIHKGESVNTARPNRLNKLTAYQKQILQCTFFNETAIDWDTLNESLSLVSTEPSHVLH